MNDYAYTLDSGDVERHAQLFAEADKVTIDGVTGRELSRVSGAQDVIRRQRATAHFYENGSRRTKHVTTNVTVRIHEDGRSAFARSYITVFQGVPDRLPLQPIFSGRYEDDFTKRDGTWRFKERRIYADSTGNQSLHVSTLEWSAND